VAGEALTTKGKRAAFALFYGPLHFIVARTILSAIPCAAEGITKIVDLGCGTGVAGAAWALVAGASRIAGIDRHPWAVEEANWTYRQLLLNGRAVQRNVVRTSFKADRETGIVAAYVANELSDADRAALLSALLAAHTRGVRVLVIEPIARRMSPWWADWQAAIAGAHGRADEWRFAVDLPPLQASLARAAGLEPRELTARSLFLPPSP
jgi:predicted RNA methylase